MVLRPFILEDEAIMIRLLTDPVIGKTYMLPDYPDRAATKALFDRMLQLSQDDRRYVRGIIWQDRLIGFLNDTGIDGACMELGYVIDPAYHNRGLMTRALKLAIQELAVLGYRRIVAGAFEDNTASLRVMEKAGMHRIDYTDCVEYHGISHRCIYYAIEIGDIHAEI